MKKKYQKSPGGLYPPSETSDSWEKANGLSDRDPADGNGDIDNDGYTNLEEYLHELTVVHGKKGEK